MIESVIEQAEAFAAAVDTVSQTVPGGLYGLVNNAGLSLNGPLELLSTTDIKKLMDVNVLGLLAVTKTFLPLLRQRRGRIINISSGHGLLAIPDKSAYAASKFGMTALGTEVSLEERTHGIRITNIYPGEVNTPILAQRPVPVPEEKKAVMVQPEDIGRAAVWLASDYADYVNGTSLFVDGGMTLYPGFTEGG